mgnify:CR=1 FL=1
MNDQEMMELARKTYAASDAALYAGIETGRTANQQLLNDGYRAFAAKVSECTQLSPVVTKKVADAIMAIEQAVKSLDEPYST